MSTPHFPAIIFMLRGSPKMSWKQDGKFGSLAEDFNIRYWTLYPDASLSPKLRFACRPPWLLRSAMIMMFSFCWKSTGLGLGLGSEVWNDVSTASHGALLCAATPLSQAERKFASGTGYILYHSVFWLFLTKTPAKGSFWSKSVLLITYRVILLALLNLNIPRPYCSSESPCHSLVAPQREARAVVDVHHCCQVAADRKVGSSLLPWRTGLSPCHGVGHGWYVFGMMLCVCLIYVVLLIEFQWAYHSTRHYFLNLYSSLLYTIHQAFHLLHSDEASFGISCFELLFIPP